MNNVEKVTKAFRKAVTEGEQKLSRGEITWKQYSSHMRDFEQQLRDLGVDL